MILTWHDCRNIFIPVWLKKGGGYYLKDDQIRQNTSDGLISDSWI